jgi:hypothetical protein
MARVGDTCWCDGCGVEITWGPVVANHRIYCCIECQQGRPCSCGERQELEEDRRRSADSAPVVYE